MKSDFLIAVTQLAAERNLPREIVLSAVEAALVSAYKKDNTAGGQDIAVKLNPAAGEVKIYALRTVVEECEDEYKEISLEEAHSHNPDAQLGDVIEIEMVPHLGRIGAQTAKQVVMQRLREAEREMVFEEYAAKEGEIVTATVQRLEPKQIILDLGRTEAVLPFPEQVPMERYRPNQRLKVYILEVARTSKGPEIIVSRTHRNLERRLLELEVPEIYSGVVEIKAIAREPGSRSKVAVFARQEGVDPVGSCVGLRGIRIQNVVNELQGEKIDVVQWHRDEGVFIAHALSPAQVLRVDIHTEENTAVVVVPDRQLSLAIGKEGQNARLASKLTGWKIDIKSSAEYDAERMQRVAPETEAQQTAPPAEAALPVAEAEAPAPAVEEEAPQVEPILAQAAAPAPEPVVAPPEEELVEAKEEAAPTLSAEEELAEVSLQEELATPTVEEEEVEEGEVLAEEDVWGIQVAAKDVAGIRFAEDIMPSWGRGRGKRRRGRKSNVRPSKGRRAAASPQETKGEGANTEAT